MPAEIFLTGQTLPLSPEFAYQLARGEATFREDGTAVEESGQLKVGDTLNRNVTVMVSGQGTLLQISHDEIARNLQDGVGAATKAASEDTSSDYVDNVTKEPKLAKEDDSADDAPSALPGQEEQTEEQTKSKTSKK